MPLDHNTGPVSQQAFDLPRAPLNCEPPSEHGAFDPGRTLVSRCNPFAGARAPTRASSDQLDDEPTRAVSVVPRTRDREHALRDLLARATLHLDAALAWTVRLWRDHPPRAAAMMAGVTLIAYLAVDCARQRASRSSQTFAVPVETQHAAGPIIVEQLREMRPAREKKAAPLRGKRSVKPGRSSVSRRARKTPPRP